VAETSSTTSTLIFNETDSVTLSAIDQWIRACELQIVNKSNPTQTLQLAEDYKIRFKVESSSGERPNLLTVRVYNMPLEKMQKIVNEYSKVTLSAGYRVGQHPGIFGIIFIGTIRKWIYGKENVTDSYLEMTASTNDWGYNYALINGSITESDPNPFLKQYHAAADAMGVQYDRDSVDEVTKFANTMGGIIPYPRGRVTFGMARVLARSLGDNMKGAQWSVQTDKFGVDRLVITRVAAQPSSQAIALTPNTGLIGIPQATEQGVVARCLINPNLRIGVKVQIDKSLILQTAVDRQGFLSWNDKLAGLPFVATTTTSGFYQILVIDHTGDTRGGEWYSDLTCLALNTDTNTNTQIQSLGNIAGAQ
jgi:hypothetical protein